MRILLLLVQKARDFILVATVLGGASLITIACGSADTYTAPAGNSPGGSNGEPPMTPENFYATCALRGGTVISHDEEGLLCRIIRDFSQEYVASTGSQFPVLTPNNPTSPSANPKHVPFYVKAGDRLQFSASNKSGWVVKDCGAICFYLFNENKLDGSDVGYYQNVRSGLVASVGGKKPFLLGYTFDGIFQTDGQFRYGYNVRVTSDHEVRTHSVSINTFRIIHCENSYGATVVCPL